MALIMMLACFSGVTVLAEEKPVTISWVSWACGDVEPDNVLELWLEEKLGIKIETKKIDLSQSDLVNLMINSGEFPDAGWLFKSSNYMNETGYIRSITEEQIRTYAPGWAGLYDAEPIGWNMDKDADGNYLCLQSRSVLGPGKVTHVVAYRYDWLQKLGIEPNGEVTHLSDNIYMGTTPFTKSQFLEIMEGFTHGDPDGDGVDNTYGIAAHNGGGSLLYYGLGAFNIFGVNLSGSMDVDGVAEYYYVTPQYKEMLGFVADLYASGYMDPAFVTTSRNESFEKIANGEFGYQENAFSTVGNGTVTSFDNMVPDNAPVLYLPLEVNDDGTGGCAPYSNNSFGSPKLFINRSVDDDKLARILEFVNYCNFDDEARITLQYGFEGETFQYQPNGVPKLLEGVNRGGSFGIWCYNSNYICEDRYAESVYGTNAWTTIQMMSKEAAAIQKLPYRIDFTESTRLAELDTLYGSNIKTIVDEFAVNAMCGNVNLDSDWDAYIDDLNSAGYAEIHDELQKADLYSDLAG